MKTKLLLTLLLAMGLMSACSDMNPQPINMDLATQNPAADHDAMAKRYENAAKEMQVKADEHKQLLSQYESKSYLYGRQAQDLKAHCHGLINAYEKAAEENLSMANLHRQR